MNRDTYASHPGSLVVNPLLWVWNYPLWPVVWLVLLVGFTWFAARVHWGFVFLALFMTWVNYRYWGTVYDHFLLGCTNPAVIVQLNPTLIAVYADLTKGDGDFPVIKIVPARLSQVAGSEARIGSRVATVALYEEDLEDESLPHWINFNPIPVEHVSTRVSESKRLIAYGDEEDWVELEQGLATVVQPYRPGLYKLGWK